MTFKTNALTYPQQLSSASNQEAIGICHQYPVWIITQSLVETSVDIIWVWSVWSKWGTPKKLPAS